MGTLMTSLIKLIGSKMKYPVNHIKGYKPYNNNIMTYINKFIVLCSLLFLFAACSKEQGQEPSSYIEPPTRLVNLDITSLIDDSEARSTHAVAEDGRTGSFIIPDKPLSIRIAVRRGATGVPVYSTLTFNKVGTTSSVRYVGQVKVPLGTGRNFQISAILLGEVNGRQYTKLAANDKVEAIPTNSLVLVAGDKVLTQVPYVADWTPLSLTADGRVLQHVRLRFKPSGSLLRLSILNDGKDNFSVKAIKVITNAFVDTWAYDFSKLGLSSGALVAGETSATGIDKTYTLPTGQTLASDARSPWYYLWVMPKTGVEARTLASEFILVTTTGEELSLPNHHKTLPTGTIPITLRRGAAAPAKRPDDISKSCFPEKRMPIEYMAHYNLDASGTGFDTTLGNTTSGLFTWDQGQAYKADPGRDETKGGTTIAGVRYYLPTQDQLRAVLPVSGLTLDTYPKVRELTETIDVGGAKSEAYIFSGMKATYKRPTAAPIVYALRLQHTQLCMTTAYRYEFVGDFVAGSLNSYLKVTCRFLGKSYPWSIDDIDNEEFWTTNTEKDVTRYLPAAREYTGVDTQSGVSGSYWASSNTNPQILKLATSTQAGLGDDFYFSNYPKRNSNTGERVLETNGAYSNKARKYPLRLFGYQPISPRNIPKQ